MAHLLATHRYLDMMTVRPSLVSIDSSGAPPASAPLSSSLNTLTSANDPSVRPFSPSERRQKQLSSAERLSKRPPRSVRGLRSTALQTLTYSSNSNQDTMKSHLSSSSSISAAGKAAATTLMSTTSRLPSHGSLLVEPVLLPSLHHVHVESPQDLEESCLFYPNGHKNRNIRREIESTVVKHHLLENRKMQNKHQKSRYRVERIDPYANAKGPPLFYSKAPDPEMHEIYSNIRSLEKKIESTVQVRV